MRTISPLDTDSSASAAQLEANRANSQLSTGPRTEQGKANSSMNAVKTGLTGRAVLLPNDDAAQYERHVARYFSDFEPAGDRESELVRGLADAQWRLNRIPSLEINIYAVARIQFKEMFQQEPAAVRAALIEAQTFITYQKQFSNLSIQEYRLRRQYQKDLAELKQLQSGRASRDKLSKFATKSAQPPAPSTDKSGIGFVFSSASSNSLDTACEPALNGDPLSEAA